MREIIHIVPNIKFMSDGRQVGMINFALDLAIEDDGSVSVLNNDSAGNTAGDGSTPPSPLTGAMTPRSHGDTATPHGMHHHHDGADPRDHRHSHRVHERIIDHHVAARVEEGARNTAQGAVGPMSTKGHPGASGPKGASLADHAHSHVAHPMAEGPMNTAAGAVGPMSTKPNQSPEGTSPKGPITSGATFTNSVYKRALAMGIPETQARLAAAQAAHESMSGRSHVARAYNNIFGVKGRGDAGIGSRAGDGDRKGHYAAYSSPEKSLEAWWGHIQRRWPDAANATTLESAAAGLHAGRRGGYAEDPKYVSKILPRMRGINGANPISDSVAAAQPAASEVAPKQLAKMALLRGKKIKNQVPYSESQGGRFFHHGRVVKPDTSFLDQGNPDDAPTNSPYLGKPDKRAITEITPAYPDPASKRKPEGAFRSDFTV
jgi:hypothetical protein